MGTAIAAIHKTDTGFRVDTALESWQCESLIIASGGLSIPTLFAVAALAEIADFVQR